MAKKKNGSKSSRKKAPRKPTFNASPDQVPRGEIPISAEEWLEMEMMANASLSRKDLLNKLLDPRRDIDDECGYPATRDISLENYRNSYDRNPIATRVVEILPKESWKVQPTIVEDEDPETITDFEQAVTDLGKDLFETGFFEDDTVNPLWDFLRRADILSGIGHYGVILLGIDDGQDLDQPVMGLDPITGEPSSKPPKEQKLLYVRAFDEALAQILTWVDDPTSPRNGKPETYQIQLNDPKDLRTGQGFSVKTVTVHWTRVIHVAEELGSSTVLATPRQRPVWNRLLDCHKLYGGSAEMYYRGAFPGLSFETHPQLGGDAKVDKAGVRTQAEQYMNSLQRYLLSTGMNVKSLAPQVVDPTPQINTQIEAICVLLAVPKRVFVGSERGELASGQDADTWNDRLMDRQRTYLGPRLIGAFLNRCIHLGILPTPEKFKVDWPDLNTTTDTERASVAVKQTEALMKYVQGDVVTLIEPLDYLTRILGMSKGDAVAVLEERSAALEDERLEDREAEKQLAEEEAEAKKLAAQNPNPIVDPKAMPPGTPTPKGNPPTSPPPPKS